MTEKAKIVLEAEDRTRAAFASLKNNMTAVQRQSVALSSAFGAIVPALTVGGLAVFAKQGIDAADALQDMSDRLGVSVKDLASFKLAAQLADTSLEGVGKGIQRLTLSMGQAEQGLSTQAKALKTLGITARDPKEAFFQLADAVANSNDPIKTNAALNDVLGKSYVDLLPLLQGGAKGLRDSAAASESFADAMVRLAPDAGRFNDQLDELKITAAGAAGEVLTRLVPSLAETSKRVGELLSEDRGISALARAFAGLGKLPFDLLIGDPFKAAGSAPERIKELKAELNGLQRDLKSAQTGGGKSSMLMRSIFGTPEEISSQISVLKNQIAAMEKFGEQVYKPKPGGAKPSEENTAQNECVLSGGTWDGKRCIPKKTTGSKADPFAPISSLLAGTDIGKLKEFDKQVALLNQRFAFGTKDTELYGQAMTALIERTFANNFKQAADDAEFWNMVTRDGQDTINEANRDTAEWKATVAATSKELLYMVNPTARLVDQLEGLDKFDGFMDPELLAEARLEINAQIDSVNGLGKEIDKTKSFGEEFGLTMKSAFEDAVLEGKDLRDVLGGIGSDLQRIVLRKTITEPLGNAFSGLIDGIDFGSLFSFANGGIMTGSGPLPLNTYATGGIASSPQFALFGEGRMNEAFVPLPDGRSIPVTMSGGGSGQVILQQTIQIDARGADAGVEARIRQAAADGARQGYSMVVDDLSRGGAVARLVGRA